MSFLTAWIELNGMLLAKGATIVLLVGGAAVCLAKTPLWKQRFAELSVLMTLAWIALAISPLPGMVRSNASVVFAPTPLAHAKQDVVFQPRDVPAPFRTDQAETLTSNVVSSTNNLPTSVQKKPIALQATSPGRILSFVFVCGAIVLCCGMLLVQAHLFWQRRFRVLVPAWLQEAYEKIPRKRNADLVLSSRVRRPMSYGILKPRIALPEDFAQEEMASTISHVLKHEQVHVDRRDAIGNLVLNLALPLLWLHPVYWFLRQQAHFSRELIADDYASRSNKQSYISALLELIESMPSQRSFATAEIRAFGLKHPFSRRMEALAKREKPLKASINLQSAALLSAISVSAVLLLATLMAVQSASADDPAAQTQNKSEEESNENQRGTDKSVRESIATPLPQPVIITNAMIEPSNRILIHAPSDANIHSILVKPGQQVKKGQELILLENHDLEVEVMFAKYQARSLRLKVSALNAARRKAKSGGIDSAIRESELELEHAEAKYDSVRKQIDRLRIVAPMSGVVDEILLPIGTPVSRGKPLVQVTNLESLKVVGHVSFNKIAGVQLLGQAASMEIQLTDNSSKNVTGVVDYVSTDLDINGMVSVYSECKNSKIKGKSQWLLRPGMVVREILIGGETQPQNIAKVDESKDEIAAISERAKELRSQESEQESKGAFRGEEVKLLQEMIVAYEEMAKFTKLNLENGTGTVQEYWAAMGDATSTKARLAVVQSDFDKADAMFQQAISSRKKAVAARSAEFKQGRCDAAVVSRDNTLLLELQLAYLKFRESTPKENQRNPER